MLTYSVRRSASSSRASFLDVRFHCCVHQALAAARQAHTRLATVAGSGRLSINPAA
jgi:hypothetical protein